MDFSARYITAFDTFIVSYVDDNGIQKKKELDVKELISVLQLSSGTGIKRTVEKTPDCFLTGVLDSYLYSGTLVYSSVRGVRPITYQQGNSEKQYLLDFPDMVFVLGVSNKKLVEMYAYCYFGELHEKTLLYELPLSNVYSGGKICMGGNHVSFDSLNCITRVFDIFYSSPFNGDLWSINKYGLTLEEQFESLAKDGFQKERMIPVGTYASVIKLETN